MYIWASLEAQLVKNSPAVQKTLVWFLGQDDSLERDGLPTPVFLGFPDGLDGKEFACNGGDLHSIPGLGKSPGGEHGNPLQYSCLESPMDREEPGRLQSMGSQSVGPEWSNLACMHAYIRLYKLFISHKFHNLYCTLYYTHIFVCYRCISCSYSSFQLIILIVFGFLSRKAFGQIQNLKNTNM